MWALREATGTQRSQCHLVEPSAQYRRRWHEAVWQIILKVFSMNPKYLLFSFPFPFSGRLIDMLIFVVMAEMFFGSDDFLGFPGNLRGGCYSSLGHFPTPPPQ